MKKSKIFKLILAIAVFSVMASVLMVSTVSADSVKISYKYGDFVRDVSVEAGAGFVPMDVTLEDGLIYYGWVDSYGNLYPKGENATVTKDTELYLVAGCEVSNEGELASAIENGNTYIRLTANVSVYSPICLDNGVFVIDTNGKTLTVNSATDAFDGKGSGIVIMGGGTVKHNYMGATPEFTLDSFIKLSPTSSMSTLFVNVCKDTTVTSPLDFIAITTNIDRFDGAFNATVHGSVTCNRLMHTRGISGATFSIYETATVTTGCEYLFEDISTTSATRLVSLTVYGGTFNLSRLAGCAKDTAKYQMAILGGAYSEDITACFANQNYVFKYNANTEMYDFQKCNHSGPIISGMPNDCVTPNVVLTYKCQYCNTVYEDKTSFVNGIGHFYVTDTIQPLIANEKVTQEGITKTYCKRCGEIKETKVTYPNPTQVYVNVVYIDELENREKTIRVPANEIFDFDAGNNTYLKYFVTAYITKEYGIARKNIISVEIPLGTTKIYGSEYTHSGTGERIPIGVFYDNTHLTEVVIPSSVVSIEKNAFRKMDKLTSIKGLENVTVSIDSCAFYQEHTNVVIDQLTLNAATIKSYAFNNIRMNSLTFGKNVSTVEANAFHLNIDEENGITPVNEVFVEGNTTNGITVQRAMSGKTYSTSGQQFGSRPIVFTEHQCDVEITVPTCKSSGYTTHTCKYCSYVLVDNPTQPLKHEFKLVIVEADCITAPYQVRRCNSCLETEPGTYLETGVRSDKHSFTGTCSIFYDEAGHMAYYQSFNTPCVEMNNKDKGFYDENNNKLLGKDYYVCEDRYAKVSACERCGLPNWSEAPKALSQWINPPVTGHSPDMSNMEIIKEPTCGDDGVGEAACLACEKIIEIPISPDKNKSHVYGDPVVTIPATCVSPGQQEFRCKNCSTEVKIGEIAILDKNDRASHLFDAGVQIRPATETTTGVMLYTCTRAGCGASYQEGISLLTPAGEGGLPVGVIIVLIIGGILLAGGIVLTLYFTLFKKKKASDNYRYKFNTLGK